jgi:hypothetical protein
MDINLIDDVANILFLGAFLFRDILALRVLSTTGYLTVLPYYYLQPEPLWTPILWTLLFISINGFQIWRLMMERRPIGFDGEQLALYNLLRDDFSAADVRKLLAAGHWRDVPAGTTYVVTGDRPDEACLVLLGGAVAKKGDRHVASFERGDLVASATALGLVPVSPIDIYFDSDSRVLAWSPEVLKRILAANGNLQSSFQSRMTREMAGRLQHIISLVPA